MIRKILLPRFLWHCGPSVVCTHPSHSAGRASFIILAIVSICSFNLTSRTQYQVITAQVGNVLSLLSLLRFKPLPIYARHEMTLAEPPLQVWGTKAASLGFFQAAILCIPQLARSHQTDEIGRWQRWWWCRFFNLRSRGSRDVPHIMLLLDTAGSMAEFRITVITGPSRRLGWPPDGSFLPWKPAVRLSKLSFFKIKTHNRSCRNFISIEHLSTIQLSRRLDAFVIHRNVDPKNPNPCVSSCLSSATGINDWWFWFLMVLIFDGFYTFQSHRKSIESPTGHAHGRTQ